MKSLAKGGGVGLNTELLSKLVEMSRAIGAPEQDCAIRAKGTRPREWMATAFT
jgi:hypothetical protein